MVKKISILPWQLRWRIRIRRIFWGSALVGLLSLLWWTNRPTLQEGVMLFAKDGDSFALQVGGQSQLIRLLGVDAPELTQTCAAAGGEDWPCGVGARDAIRKLAPKGSPLRCRTAGTDRFDRALSRCRLNDGRDLGAELVSHGWAVATDEDYILEQDVARTKKAGIWQGGFKTPAEWRTSHPRQ